MEGNFGGRKIWRIGCKPHIDEIKFGKFKGESNLLILRLKIIIPQNCSVIFKRNM